MFSELLRHKAIAWDLDETLIDHPASYFLQEFINLNPQIEHSIVTFRTHGMENDIWQDIASYPHSPLPSAFKRVFHPSNKIFSDYQILSTARADGLLTGPLMRGEIDFLEWKGKICADNGLSVLVDDRTNFVEIGCKKYGIVLFHPDEFK